MTTFQLETDYLIAGSGAVGMAFADVILTETDADMIIVDRHAKPGGHWNDAYPFVTLHQPSQFYGVSSKELSRGEKDKVGLNKGLFDLASGAEVSAYFDDVMRHQFLPSGRVKYFPMCNYQQADQTDDPKSGRFISRVSGKEHLVKARKKLIDATYLKTSVPSTHTPNFKVGEDVRFIPLNDLPRVETPPDNYVVIGAGKTGVDACLWLLEQGVNPDMITWIVNRDAWMLNRQNTQFSDEFFVDTLGAHANQMQSIAEADTIEDMFDRLEACGYFIRIDKNVRPQMFHGATSSLAEVEQLRRIKNVVRMGYVTELTTDEITLERGEIPTTPNTLHVDCSARAVANDVLKPVFEGDVITPQMIRPYQPVFSAAMIAYIELNYETEEDKNRVSRPVPLPNADTDYILFTLASLINQREWLGEPKLQKWIASNRLDGASKLVAGIKPEETDKKEILMRIKEFSPRAASVRRPKRAGDCRGG